MWSPKSREKDQRHTLDPQVPSPIPWPRAMGAATGGFREGNTVHLEKDTIMSPWWEAAAGACEMVLRLAAGPKVQTKGRQATRGTLWEPPASSAQPGAVPGTAATSPRRKDHPGPGPGPPVFSCLVCRPQLCSRLSLGCTTV